MRITNNSGIGLPLAVWLVHDDYDYIDKPNYFSVTTLMKPLKQILLAQRIPDLERKSDVTDYIARAYGSTIHAGMEKAWTDGYARSMKLLGYPQAVIDLIRVNPQPEELAANPDLIPVYLEQRLYREIEVDGTVFTIGGKFDMVADGIVQDTKSTSAWGWVFGTRDSDHQKQLSKYRWLDAGQEHRKITADHGQVNYVFTDWQKAMARSNPNYPQRRVEEKHIPLLSLDEVEAMIRHKLKLIMENRKISEADMPECSDEELWRSAPKYKYFSDPTKITGRSTRNFEDASEARKFMAEKGGKGIIITQPGEVKACIYCAGFDACRQKDQYFPNGLVQE